MSAPLPAVDEPAPTSPAANLDPHAKTDPYKWHVIGWAALFVLTLPLIAGTLSALQPKPAEAQWGEWVGWAHKLDIPPHTLASGEALYKSSCATCHGADGQGVPRLGKPLRNSEFVQGASDKELLSLIMKGRLPSDPANTTGVPMPPRAGNPTLREDRLQTVVGYLRTLQDSDEPTASLDNWIVAMTAPGNPETGDSAPAVAGGVGHDAFVASCSACHGPQGQGVEGLGKALAASAFIQSKTDAELLRFVKSGRPIWDSENTTGLDMPPKGGNPALNDEQLGQIIAYIRTLNLQSEGL